MRSVAARSPCVLLACSVVGAASCGGEPGTRALAPHEGVPTAPIAMAPSARPPAAESSATPAAPPAPARANAAPGRESGARFASTSPGRCDLVRGGDDLLIVSGERVLQPGPRGLERRPAIERLLARATDDEEVHLLLGRTAVVRLTERKNVRHLRPGGAPAARVEGTLHALAAAGAGELWHTMVDDVKPRLAWVEGTAVRPLSLPAAAGPAVPGLSALGAALCAEPQVLAVGGDPEGPMAVLGECHREAPLHVVRWALPRLEPTETLVQPEPPLEPSAFVVRRDEVVIAGRLDGRAVVARRTSGQWSSAMADDRASHVDHVALDGARRAWVVALGRGPDGKDDWQLLREEDGRLARVSLRDPGGLPLRVPSIAFHPATGVVVCAWSDAGSWLLAEEPGFAL